MGVSTEKTVWEVQTAVWSPARVHPGDAVQTCVLALMGPDLEGEHQEGKEEMCERL